MFRLLPTILLVFITGCSLEGEVEYGQSQAEIAAETTMDGDTAHRQMQREQARLDLRARWRGSYGGEEDAARIPTEEKYQSPPVIVHVEPKPQAIHTGDTNIHVGDIHHHEHRHIHVDQSVTVTAENSEVRLEPAARSATPVDRPVSSLDERCERLRREHEARLSGWSRLFSEG